MDLKNVGDLNLLTALVWGEARGERDFESRVAVAWVVRNRVANIRWPNTYTDVILQPKQFSCFNPNDVNYSKVMDALFPSKNANWLDMVYRECRLCAHAVINNWWHDVSNGANHYFATYITPPKWAKMENVVATLGKHIFLKL